MELLLIILITLGLMVGIIYGLRRYRKVELEKNADRYNPLPPLDESGATDLDIKNIHKDLGALSDQAAPLKESSTTQNRPAPSGSAKVVDRQPEQSPQATVPAANGEPRKFSSTVRIIPRDQVANRARLSTSDDQTKSETTPASSSSSGIASRQQTRQPTATASTNTKPVQQTSTGLPQAVINQLASTPADLEVLPSESRRPEPESAPEQVNLLPEPEPDDLLPERAQDEIVNSKPQLTAAAAETTGNDVSTASGDNKSWQDKVAELKRNGQLSEALVACSAEYPLWGAYSQASIIVRALLKETQDQADLETGLQQLYNIATQAELLHEKIAGLPGLSSQQLKKLELEKLAKLDLPYQQVGYKKLRLLKKTDLKLLSQLWGEPDAHQSPREYCRQQWQALVAEL